MATGFQPAAAFPNQLRDLLERYPLRQRRLAWILTLLLMAASLLINSSLFLPGEFPLPYYYSVEAGYASMGRFVSEHPNPWGWKPEQYCGLPTQYAYLPLVPYLTGMWMRLLPSVDPLLVHRWVVTAIACAGPATVFLLILLLTRSHWWALVTSISYLSFAPWFLYIQSLRADGGNYPLPWRLHVLVKYGEGPHNIGLTLLPLALIACWRAAVGRRFRDIFLAALAMMLVTLSNWISAMSLAWCCLLLMLANLGVAHETGFRARRLFAAAILAWLLSAFWLTPDFISTTAFNWPKDAYGFRLREEQLRLQGIWIAGILLIRLLFARAHRQTWLCFLSMSAFTFSFIAVVKFLREIYVVPEAHRYLPEAALFTMLTGGELLRQLALQRPAWIRRTALAASVLVVLGAAYQGRRYFINVSANIRPQPPGDRGDYKVIRWLERNPPRGRVFSSGQTRFHLNTRHRFQQIGGTFESGVRNRVPIDFSYQIQTAIGLEESQRGSAVMKQLRALGVEYLVVHGPLSSEPYRDVQFPERFEGLAWKVFHHGDDHVYRLPFDSLAHLLRPDEIPLGLATGAYTWLLDGYVAALDDPRRPKLGMRWLGPNRIEIRGAVPAGYQVSVMVSYDPGWKAWQNGRPVAIATSPLGFLELLAFPDPGAQIFLEYHGRTQTKLMTAVSAFTWLGCGVVFYRRRRAPGSRLDRGAARGSTAA